MNFFRQTKAVAILWLSIHLIACVATDSEIAPVTLELLTLYEPVRTCLDHNQLRNPYFGDLHVHTRYSLDAYGTGTRTTPVDAYAFAQGARIGLPPYNNSNQALRHAQLDRPLDFAMVSDHAEFFGDAALCTNPDSQAYHYLFCGIYRAQNRTMLLAFLNNIASSPTALSQNAFCGKLGIHCENHSITLWQQAQLAAEQAYDRSEECSFSSFIGYEWTGTPKQAGNGIGIVAQNLHRNVLFANAHVPATPTSYFNAPYPEDLWGELTDKCLNSSFSTQAACNVLTIPHNSNVSAGIMFEQMDKHGLPIDTRYAQQRAKFEPLVELIQHKGNSECLHGLGTNDEACTFEQLPWGHLYANLTNVFGAQLIPQTAPDSRAFVRDALKQGLKQHVSLGVNPFQYGFVGSTDTHLSAPGLTDENNFPGHLGSTNPQLNNDNPSVLVDNPSFNPGGLTVVWAEQNTRSALFSAMQRKEVYATSGPRQTLRFFGAWEYADDLCDQIDWLATAYQLGVPMGAELPLPAGGAPKFLVSAVKDPQGNDLQRIQIVKGWLDATGTPQEQIYEVAGNQDNGASVNLNTCLPSGVGATNLCTVWQDPDFNSIHAAFYYARVLENPSCRWTQHQCVNSAGAAGCDLIDQQGQSVPKTIQERAWSSPIWYAPQS